MTYNSSSEEDHVTNLNVSDHFNLTETRTLNITSWFWFTPASYSPPVTTRVRLILVHLNHVAVGVFGVGADSHTEKRLRSVRPRYHLQDLHEVVFVPGTRHVPAPYLNTQFNMASSRGQ